MGEDFKEMSCFALSVVEVLKVMVCQQQHLQNSTQNRVLSRTVLRVTQIFAALQAEHTLAVRMHVKWINW